MKLPTVDLPFFAYGIFKPGQLGFLRVQEFVEYIEPKCELDGTLRERDGLPIIDEEGEGRVQGSLLFFGKQEAVAAYSMVNEIEPEKHYKWDVGEIRTTRGIQKATVLFGKNPRKGSSPFEQQDWDGKKDPLFTSALEVVHEIMESNTQFEWDLKPLFRLQMAYLLLWSSIERYVSLRYHLGDKVTAKVNHMAEEEAFVLGLQEQVLEGRRIYRADRPNEKVQLDPSKPKESLLYYYQVRSNITHRGKAATRDFDTLKHSLEELHKIFRKVLDTAFRDSESASLQENVVPSDQPM